MSITIPDVPDVFSGSAATRAASIVTLLTTEESSLFTGYDGTYDLSTDQVAFLKKRTSYLIDLQAQSLFSGDPYAPLNSGLTASASLLGDPIAHPLPTIWCENGFRGYGATLLNSEHMGLVFANDAIGAALTDSQAANGLYQKEVLDSHVNTVGVAYFGPAKNDDYFRPFDYLDGQKMTLLCIVYWGDPTA